MKNCVKRWLVCLFAASALLFGAAGGQVFADSAADLSKTGAVSVVLEADGAVVPDAEFSFYHVANAVIRENELRFSYTAEFRNCGVSLQNPKADDAQKLFEYIQSGSIDTAYVVAKTDESGRLKVTDLPLGVYLAAQTGSTDGFSDCTPFLVALPYYRDGAWQYETDASPKTDVRRLVSISVKKRWNDGYGDTGDVRRPDRVTVALKSGKNTLGTAVLSEQNGWSHVWENIPMAENLSVRETDVPSGYTALYERDGNAFTVTNTVNLIKTGQLKWPVPLLAGCGVLLFAAGCGLVCFEKRKKDE